MCTVQHDTVVLRCIAELAHMQFHGLPWWLTHPAFSGTLAGVMCQLALLTLHLLVVAWLLLLAAAAQTLQHNTLSRDR